MIIFASFSDSLFAVIATYLIHSTLFLTRSLHKDVKKLILMMEAKPADKGVSVRERKPRTVSISAKPSAVDYEAWNLNLPDVISIVKQNYSESEPEELLQRVDKARKSFAQLQSLQQNQAAMKAEVRRLDSLYQVNGLFSSDALSSFGFRRNSDKQRTLISRAIEQTERLLRSQMGLTATDGRLITPVDE